MKAIRSMLPILAAAAFAAAATMTPAHASAMNTTTGAKNTIAAPAAQYAETCAVFTTAPPATANLLAAKAPEDVGKAAIAVLSNEIAFTETRVCPADGPTEANFVKVLANCVPAPEDVGKAAATTGINGVISDYIGDTHTALGGGVPDGVAVIFTA